MPTECSRDLFGFAPVQGRRVEAAFDGGAATSDAGALLLGATDRAIRLIGRFADCFEDGRDAGLIDHAIGIGEQRVDVQLLDLGEIDHQLRDLDERRGDGVEIGRTLIAVSLEQPVDPRAEHQLVGKVHVERGQAERLIVDHLDRRTAMAEHHHWPELGIGGFAIALNKRCGVEISEADDAKLSSLDGCAAYLTARLAATEKA